MAEQKSEKTEDTIDIVFVKTGRRYTIRRNKIQTSGLIRIALDGDKEAKEVPIGQEHTEIAEKAVLAYMNIWGDANETPGPKIEPVTFSKYSDFMTPEEVALANAIRDACGEDAAVQTKVFTSITHAANYMGMPEMMKKFGAVTALAYMTIKDFQVIRERIKDLRIPTDFVWNLGDRYQPADLLTLNPSIAREINANREMPELETVAVADDESSEESSEGDSES